MSKADGRGLRLKVGEERQKISKMKIGRHPCRGNNAYSVFIQVALHSLEWFCSAPQLVAYPLFPWVRRLRESNKSTEAQRRSHGDLRPATSLQYCIIACS
jgi:hypothetical protein